jgi:hypothetical protein
MISQMGAPVVRLLRVELVTFPVSTMVNVFAKEASKVGVAENDTV